MKLRKRLRTTCIIVAVLDLVLAAALFVLAQIPDYVDSSLPDASEQSALPEPEEATPEEETAVDPAVVTEELPAPEAPVLTDVGVTQPVSKVTGTTVKPPTTGARPTSAPTTTTVVDSDPSTPGIQPAPTTTAKPSTSPTTTAKPSTSPTTTAKPTSTTTTTAKPAPTTTTSIQPTGTTQPRSTSSTYACSGMYKNSGDDRYQSLQSTNQPSQEACYLSVRNWAQGEGAIWDIVVYGSKMYPVKNGSRYYRYEEGQDCLVSWTWPPGGRYKTDFRYVEGVTSSQALCEQYGRRWAEGRGYIYDGAVFGFNNSNYSLQDPV